VLLFVGFASLPAMFATIWSLFNPLGFSGRDPFPFSFSPAALFIKSKALVLVSLVFLDFVVREDIPIDSFLEGSFDSLPIMRLTLSAETFFDLRFAAVGFAAAAFALLFFPPVAGSWPRCKRPD
jgi:hypothetical protein